jgi:hypothetical protein
VGLGFTTDDDLKKAEGVNINLWAGVAMVVLAALFGLWATVRPLFAKATTGDDGGERG